MAILGSTGSVGTQTLDVIAHHPERFRVVALTAGGNADLLAEQAARHRPSVLACAQEAHTDPRLRSAIPGEDGLISAATHEDVDVVVVATSGHAAILPTARALAAGKIVALANKESIVCAGDLIAPLVQAHGGEIRPVDSEHSALWQALGHSDGHDVRRLILTASGGPFRDLTGTDLERVTVEAALAHPTWAMGGKITIDSATLMNKGLELIEARWLFGLPYDRLDVVVHPESIVHSLVEFADGSQVAQLGLPDMRLPIQYALTYPNHRPGPAHRLDLTEVGALRFLRPAHDRFPAIGVALDAGRAGATYPTVLSAADEIAVEAFVRGRLRFPQIVDVVRRTLELHRPSPVDGFDAIADADRWARLAAEDVVRRIATG